MTTKILKTLIAIFFLAAVFLFFTMPVFDVDFPWHVKTGQYICIFHEIPKTDPFTNASNGSLTERFILSQYWLAQVLFYLLFSKFGPIAIVILRSLVLTGIISLLWFAMRRTPVILKAVILYFTATMFIAYSGERPQLFSFLFALVTVMLLEKYRDDHAVTSLFFLPLLMVVWANVHGGFIMGDVLIMIVCVSETVKYFFLGKHSPALTARPLFLLVGSGLISVIVSYVNPNGYAAFVFAIGGTGSPIVNAIKEYIPPLTETWGPFVNRNNFIYWGIMAYVLTVLALNLRRSDITHIMLVAFTVALSLTAVRYVPFFMMTGLLIAGRYRLGIGDVVKFRWAGKLASLLYIATLAAAIFWSVSRAEAVLPGWTSLRLIGGSVFYCEGAARFIDRNIEKGNIFNSHNSGSYLLFRLYPKFKTFIDTRAYNIRNVYETVFISNAERWVDDTYNLTDTMGELLPAVHGTITITAGKRPAHPPKEELWRGLLKKHNIDIIVHEATNFYSSEMYALPLKLIEDDDWKLVFLDGRVMVFVKDIPRFRKLIARYGLEKNKVFDEIGMENARKVGRPHAGIYSSLAFALLMKGGSEEAVKKLIKQALYLDPKDLTASYLDAYMKLRQKKR